MLMYYFLANKDVGLRV